MAPSARMSPRSSTPRRRCRDASSRPGRSRGFRAALGRDDDGVGAEAAVEDAGGVGGGERVGELDSQIERGARRHGLAANLLAERAPAHVLEGQEQASVLFADLEERGDAGVGERRGGVRVLDEPGAAGRVAHDCVGHQLDGDGAPELRVARAVHLAEHAGADNLEDVVPAETVDHSIGGDPCTPPGSAARGNPNAPRRSLAPARL